MNTSTEHDSIPSPRQQRRLRELADQRGESFAYPATSAEASTEIERLLGRRRSTRVEQGIERHALSRDMADRGGATAIRDSEIEGYGSTARWAVGE